MRYEFRGSSGLVTPPASPSELPIIGLPALLQLADWFPSRRLNYQQGASSGVNDGQTLSPPAPDHGGLPSGPTPLLADTPRRLPRANSERSQSRRGPATRKASGPSGG